MKRLHRLVHTTDLAATAAEADRAGVRAEQRRMVDAMRRPLDQTATLGASLAAGRIVQHRAIAAGERQLEALRARERSLDAVVVARRRRAEQVALLSSRADRALAARHERLEALATDDVVSSRIARSVRP